MTDADSLQTYRDKRDFGRTSEPAGGEKEPSEQPIFVIQKHDARNLHYDFRLEVDGVLKSWAVPKGPSTNPSDKRLAMPTEYHPLEYADFEDVIPEGEYGAGIILVWDTGTYRNLMGEKEDLNWSMERAIKEGHVEVWLEGQKLAGGYALIRFREWEDEAWLLIKMKDDHADPERDLLKTRPESVPSGRTLEEVAEEEGDN